MRTKGATPAPPATTPHGSTPPALRPDAIPPRYTR
jgi:hypothetical protein